MATALLWFDQTLGWWSWQITSSDPAVLIVPVGGGLDDEALARQTLNDVLTRFGLRVNSPVGVIENVGASDGEVPQDAGGG